MAVPDNTPRTPVTRNVSKLSAAPGLESSQRRIAQPIELARVYVVLDLLVPCGRVKFAEPPAKRSQFRRRQRLDFPSNGFDLGHCDSLCWAHCHLQFRQTNVNPGKPGHESAQRPHSWFGERQERPDNPSHERRSSIF